MSPIINGKTLRICAGCRCMTEQQTVMGLVVIFQLTEFCGSFSAGKYSFYCSSAKTYFIHFFLSSTLQKFIDLH